MDVGNKIKGVIDISGYTVKIGLSYDKDKFQKHVKDVMRSHGIEYWKGIKFSEDSPILKDILAFDFGFKQVPIRWIDRVKWAFRPSIEDTKMPSKPFDLDYMQGVKKDTDDA